MYLSPPEADELVGAGEDGRVYALALHVVPRWLIAWFYTHAYMISVNVHVGELDPPAVEDVARGNTRRGGAPAVE